ncbi:hypothetical protein KV697_03965 [Sphingomonas sanguinis]|uniref:Uncharacterized protein n=1 Tax=Sphingomonas sanguinis TaxID=33051 RepID=A0ABU5LNS5_9SPHN|nr:hypothetical protein [Sphingomonas sanguinis]MDZ7281593.1 hypothetical protein [Sphingomonas sanguinis]QXT36498.1 hypothetical protein KV697_03965 [Sphingomonas sanguinis]
MMLLALLMLSADPGTPPSTMPSIGQLPERCIKKETRVSQSAPSVGLRKLNEMPDAEAQFAVVRQIDGCPVAAMVRTKAKRR